MDKGGKKGLSIGQGNALIGGVSQPKTRQQTTKNEERLSNDVNQFQWFEEIPDPGAKLHYSNQD